jgi:glycosyltransferase involved in cell wall biosynthesis
VASWHIKAFQQSCLHLKSRTVGVACGDNQWSGTLRQRLASATSSMHLRKFYDAAFVPGERQAIWARHMGFDESTIWRGTFAPDVEGFSASGMGRRRGQTGFVFAGRLAPEKGLATMAAAYKNYARASEAAGREPWICVVAGTGPLDGALDHPGFVRLGFVQPDALPKLFAQAGCFLLPSLKEPWGVAIQEAAASGLPIICTKECGASVHLVQDNYNGYLVDAGNVGQLESAMMRMALLSPERRGRMADAGRLLALQFTPQRWATTILEKGSDLQRRLKRI